jgi:hypothetical protein
MATIKRGTVIRATKPGVGRQKLSAFGTNGSQSLGLGRYIYTFGLLNTSGIDGLLGTIWYIWLLEGREVLRLRELRRKMRQDRNVIGDIYPRKVSMRRAIPGRVVRRWGNTWTWGGLGSTKAGREGLGIVWTPIPGSGLPLVHLEPGGKGILSRQGTRGGPALVRNWGQDVLQGELIARRELGDYLVVTPWNGTLRGHRADISVVRGPEGVLWGGRGDGWGVPDRDAHRLPGTFWPGHVVLEAGGHVVGVRLEVTVEGDGRRRAAVKGAGMVHVLEVLEQQLVLSTAGGEGRGRGRMGWMELSEGRVVN